MSIQDAKAIFGMSATGTGDRPWIQGTAVIGQNQSSMTLTGGDIAFAGELFLGKDTATGSIDLTDLSVTGATEAAVAAALTTAITGSNNDIVWTADTAGAAGNDITIAYVIAVGATTVEVVGSAITVTCATGTLASAVRTAVDAHAPAAALVGSANAAANDGTGAVIAMAATALTGGSDASAWTGVSVDFQGDAYVAPSMIQGILIYCETGLVELVNTSGTIMEWLAVGQKYQTSRVAGLPELLEEITFTASEESTVLITILAKS